MDKTFQMLKGREERRWHRGNWLVAPVVIQQFFETCLRRDEEADPSSFPLNTFQPCTARQQIQPEADLLGIVARERALQGALRLLFAEAHAQRHQIDGERVISKAHVISLAMESELRQSGQSMSCDEKGC